MFALLETLSLLEKRYLYSDLNGKEVVSIRTNDYSDYPRIYYVQPKSEIQTRRLPYLPMNLKIILISISTTLQATSRPSTRISNIHQAEVITEEVITEEAIRCSRLYKPYYICS
jgi:hypothetical protein